MIRIFGGSDQGCVRPNNQDAFTFEVLDGDTAYVILCDGMGGEAGGHIASAKAVEIIAPALRRALKNHVPDHSIRSVLSSAACAANAVIYDMASADESLRGMGTTLVLLVVRGDTAFIGHVGDSRLYSLSPDGGLTRVTHDHSIVQMLVDREEITEEQARVHPKRNYITRALGVAPDVELEYMEQAFEKGRLLLCTDGLYQAIRLEEHIDLLITCASEQDVYLLIDEANKAGGEDNITAVVVAR